MYRFTITLQNMRKYFSSTRKITVNKRFLKYSIIFFPNMTEMFQLHHFHRRNSPTQRSVLLHHHKILNYWKVVLRRLFADRRYVNACGKSTAYTDFYKVPVETGLLQGFSIVSHSSTYTTELVLFR